MTELDSAIVERKLDFIRKALKDVKEIVENGKDAYLKDHRTQLVMERLIERIVEPAVDLSNHILRKQFSEVAPTYREAFLHLSKHGILANELSKQLAPFAGLRNLIAHQYEEIDHEKVFHAAEESLSVFVEFIGSIEFYLNPKSGK